MEYDITKNISIMRRLSPSFSLRIKGDSMYPFLKDTELITIVTIDPILIRIGDVIVYRQFDSHMTVHRVIDIITMDDNSLKFVTKGDNNPGRDRYEIVSSQILGKVQKANWFDVFKT